jgi:FixJ family two-component response regulator
MLTDVVMPRMSGPDLVERLEPWHPEMKVLYVSGYTDNAIAQHGIPDAGAALLQKPFSVESLLQKVRQVLATPRRPKP